MRQDTNLLSLVAAAGAGALFMYYLDAKSGARRRALVRDTVVSSGRDAARRAQASGKHATDRMKGLAARVRGALEPGSDEHLREQIRARLGHVTSHLRSLRIEANGGDVCLRGHVLARDLDRVLAEVKAMPGVTTVRSELIAHDTSEGLPAGPDHPLSPHETQEHAHDAWNEQGL